MKRNGHKKIKTIRDLQPDSRNANKGTPRGLQMVEDSLRTYGAGRSILVDKRGGVIAGNKTLQSASDIDLPIRVVETDGKELVVVQRTDLDLNSKKARELGIADNRSSQVGLEWDAEILAQLKDEGVELSGMFTEKELAALLPQGESKDAEPQIDKAEELQQKWQVATGEIIQIGRHRLCCGDSTEKADVGRLCAGNKPLLMVTDPPYGVDYDPHWRDDIVGEFGKRAARGNAATNDDLLDWTAAFNLFEGSAAYVWHAGKFAAQVALQLTDCGFEIRNQIVWAKQHFAISRGNYHWQHEPCWYAVKKGKRSEWVGDRTQSTLWEISSLNPAGRQEERQAHGTQKPLECMARPIRNHEGDVYDPFVGSGTTLVAAENLNRTCYAMEISPEYCAVVLERMTTAFPHLEIKREETAIAA